MVKRQMKLLIALLLIAGSADVYAIRHRGETVRNTLANNNARKHAEQQDWVREKSEKSKKVSKPMTNEVVAVVASVVTVPTIAAQNAAAKKKKRALKTASAALTANLVDKNN